VLDLPITIFRAERAKLIGIREEDLDALQNAEKKHRKTASMIGFPAFASHVGEKWKNL